MIPRLLLVVAFAATARTDVLIYDCCPPGSMVNEDHSCLPLPPSVPKWTPAVFSPEEGALLAPGTVPDSWKTKHATMPVCGPGEAPYFIPSDPASTPSFVLLVNGSLVLTSRHELVPANVSPGRYCFNIAGCFVCVRSSRALNVSQPRVKKCCGRGAVFSEKRQSCKVHSENLDVPGVTLVEGFPVCSAGEVFAISGKLDDDSHRLMPNGSLRQQNRVVTAFCIDHIFEHPNDGVHVFTCSLPGAPEPSKNDIRFTLYPVGLFLSVFFLAVTLVASCLLPSTYHVLHWRCQTNHVACLMVGDLLLAITQLGGTSLVGPACAAIGESLVMLLL